MRHRGRHANHPAIDQGRGEFKDSLSRAEEDALLRTLFFLIKALFVLALFGGIGMLGYALIFDLPAPERDVVIELPAPSGQ